LRRVFLWLGIPLLVIVAGVLTALEIFLHRAEPVLRERVIEALSARFDSRVELGAFHVSLVRGFEVSGENLAIYPYNLDSNTPTFSVKSFSFRTFYSNILRRPMEISHVNVAGLHINLPPKSERKELPKLNQNGSGGHGKVDIFVGEIRAADTVLVLGTDKPGKVPLEFDIRGLDLKSVGAGRPLAFTATLVNPKPVGDIHSTGNFGPWDSDDPGSTAVSGKYSFSNANLGTLKGIGGILSSTGHYQGTLDNIVVDGETDTPDFQLSISGHKVPLHTDFHAIVDGSNGDTYLQPVVAHLLHSSFTARGYVVRNQGAPGHDIELNVDMSHANIQDLLLLAVRTYPPIMTGQVRMHTKLDLPPGPQDVAQRLKLQGQFAVVNVYFSNPKIQSKVDELSLRSQGKPNVAKQESRDPNTANIGSSMQGNFNLAQGSLKISHLVYDVPGAAVNLNGTYTLDGKTFDFHGTARLKATVSQMVGGWKGLLLSPVDKFFEKDGAGTEVPIKISGTQSEPHFGLDFGHDKDQQPQKK
jgi:hypothetical protein